MLAPPVWDKKTASKDAVFVFYRVAGVCSMQHQSDTPYTCIFIIS